MEQTKSNRKIIIGIILFILGAILFAQNLGLINIAITGYIFKWQSILIFIGIFAIAGRPKRKLGYILTMIGIVFWLPVLFNIEAHLIIWPALLIGIGVFTLFRSRFEHGCSSHRQNHMAHAFVHCKNNMDNKIKVEKRED